MNNLYRWAMSEYLPYEGFKWLRNIDKFDIMSINVNFFFRDVSVVARRILKPRIYYYRIII